MYKKAALHRTRLVFVALLMVTVSVVGLVMVPKHAFGAVGGAGNGGGGGGGSWGWTFYGHGWDEFSVTGTGPSRGFHTGTWSVVKQRCIDDNAAKVMVYVLGTGDGTSPTGDGGWMGYDYHTAYDGWSGGSPPGGVSSATAKARYNTLPASDRAGYTWGVDVAWFCWDFNPPLNYNIKSFGSMSAQYAPPGATVTANWKVWNDGDGAVPSTTNVNAVAKWSPYPWPAAVPQPIQANPYWTDWGAFQQNSIYISPTQRSCDRKPAGGSFPAHSDASPVVCNNVFTIPSNAPVGTQYCQRFYISPATPSNNTTASAPICVIVSKAPHLQVHGGDVRALKSTLVCPSPPSTGSSIRTSLWNAGGVTYGSWAEFGAFSACKTTGFATGAGLLGGGTSAQSSWSGLTFANTPLFGFYSGGNPVYNPTLAQINSCADIPSATTYGSFNAFKAAVAAGDVQGTRCIQSPPGVTVVIDTNVKLHNTPGSVASLPQVIIIADTIKVRAGVSQVDAWLLARNSLYTCVDATNARFAALSSALCNAQLVVNGPVVTQHLYADRTYGGDVGTEDYGAEVFNLPASTLLWYYQHFAANKGTLQTVSSREVPPRY